MGRFTSRHHNIGELFQKGLSDSLFEDSLGADQFVGASEETCHGKIGPGKTGPTKAILDAKTGSN